MNHLSIERAQKKYTEHFKILQQLEKQVNLSFSTLNQTFLLLEKEKNNWVSLKQKGENMSKQIVKELHELERTHFSAESDKLREAKEKLIDQYQNLLKVLNEKKSFIAEQRRKNPILIVPFPQEVSQIGYCYSCKIDISNKFSYQVEKELQSVLNIKIAEEARFCSKDCLSKYCEKYKEWNKSQRAKREVHQTKITENRKLLTQLQEEKTRLQEKINKLEKKAQETKTLYEESKRTNWWQKLLQKIGIRKDNSLQTKLCQLKKSKQNYELELEKKQAYISQIIFQLSIIDKQQEFQQKLIRGYQAMARNKKLKKELAVWDETLGDSYK